MGVSGLSTYLKQDPSSNFTSRQLHKTTVIVDGGNFVYWLYTKSHLPCHFGGELLDAISFTAKLLDLFDTCCVKPIFLFDGCHPSSGAQLDQNLKNCSHQLKNFEKFYRKIKTNDDADFVTDNNSSLRILPELMCPLLKRFLRESGRSLLMCQRGADSQIVELALNLNCPVLTNDSDFYIFRRPVAFSDGVVDRYCVIPLDSLSLKSEPINCGQCRIPSCRAINCLEFNPTKIRSDFTAIPQPLVPLVAVMSGDVNAGLKLLMPEAIMSMLSKGGGNLSNQCRKLRAIIKWLASYKNTNNCIDQVLTELISCQPSDRRIDRVDQLNKCLANYVLDPTGSIGKQLTGLLSLINQPEHFLIHSLSLSDRPSPVSDGFNSQIDEKAAHSIPALVNRVKKALPAFIDSTEQLPAWRESDLFVNWPDRLTHCFLSGSLSLFLDPLYVTGGAVFRPLIEDVANQRESCLTASLPLMDLFYSLLVGLDWPQQQATEDDSGSVKLRGIKLEMIAKTATYSFQVRHGSEICQFNRTIQPIDVQGHSSFSLMHLITNQLSLDISSVDSSYHFFPSFVKGLILLGSHWLLKSNQTPDTALYQAWLITTLVTFKNLESCGLKSKQHASILMTSCCRHYKKMSNWAKQESISRQGTGPSSDQLMPLVHQLNQLQCIIIGFDSLINVVNCITTPSSKITTSSRGKEALTLWPGWILLPSGRLIYWLTRYLQTGSTFNSDGAKTGIDVIQSKLLQKSALASQLWLISKFETILGISRLVLNNNIDRRGP